MTVYSSLSQIENAVADSVGFRLFTVLGFIHDGRTMVRLHSSLPETYPPGGTKDVATEVSPEWAHAALVDQVPYCGETEDDIRRVFGDSELILSLGCGSIINVPILRDGETIGCLNILDAAGRYTPAHVAAAIVIARNSTEVVASANGSATLDKEPHV